RPAVIRSCSISRIRFESTVSRAKIRGAERDSTFRCSRVQGSPRAWTASSSKLIPIRPTRCATRQASTSWTGSKSSSNRCSTSTISCDRRRRSEVTMELYLDSVDFKEIEAAFDFGFVKGLTTTPTFMHRHGITDIDGAIVKLSGMVPELQVEALGDTCDAIVKEADRLLGLDLKREPVFKVPISNAGVKACKRLTD